MTISSADTEKDLKFLERLIETSGPQGLQGLQADGSKQPPIENIVFEGGGAKGIVYIGALEVLEEAGIKPKRVAGSSAGGIIAGLVAAGFSAEEIKHVMTVEMNLLDLMDSRTTWDPKLKGFPIGFSNIVNLFKHKGLFKGDAFKKIMTGLLKRKLEEGLKQVLKNKHPDYPESGIIHLLDEILEKYHIADLGHITFGQMHALKEDYPELGLLDLYITTTRLTDGSLKVFSHEQDPNAEVV